MKAIALVVLLTQVLNHLALLNVARPLTIGEIATVLNAARQALTAKTVRLSSVPDGQRSEVLMGEAGWPKLIRMTYGIERGIVSGVVGSSTTPQPAQPKPSHVSSQKSARFRSV